MDREEGYYWVKLYGVDRWTVREYYGSQWYCGPSMTDETEIEEVGPKIEPPKEG